MKLNHCYLLAVLLFQSLTHSAQEFVEQKAFNYYNNGQIAFNEAKLHLYNLYKITDGDKLVFEYITDNGGDPGNHSKAKTVIAFQLENGINKFELKDTKIEAHGGIYMQACECQDVGIHPITKGIIKGQKNKNGSWTVQMDVTIKGRVTGKEYRFEFENNYNLVNH